jgi:hypothetical protein
MKTILIAAFATFAALSATNIASADILPDGNGGALCKDTKKHPGSCTLLAATCKGTYTDGGNGYGKCTQVYKVKVPATLAVKQK